MAIENWKNLILREYHDKPEAIGRKVAREHGVKWATCWDFKQKIIQGDVTYEDSVTKPKILLFDIETSPIMAHVWGLWMNNVSLNQIQEDWYMLSWAGKWLGEDEIFSDCIFDHDLFETEPENDKHILESLWQMLDEADIIIGHNVKKFDNKKTKARFLSHGMKPPSSYRIIDTLSIAKKEFALTSNKLDFLATFLGLPNKTSHEGHELWTKCMRGDPVAWGVMMEYNEWDVGLLELVYLKIRGWYQAHPNVAVYYNDLLVRCTTCGSSDVKETTSTVATNTGLFDELECGCCGKRSKDGFNNLPIAKRKARLTNIVH